MLSLYCLVYIVKLLSGWRCSLARYIGRCGNNFNVGILHQALLEVMISTIKSHIIVHAYTFENYYLRRIKPLIRSLNIIHLLSHQYGSCDKNNGYDQLKNKQRVAKRTPFSAQGSFTLDHM